MPRETARSQPEFTVERLLALRFSPDVRQWIRSRTDVIGTAIGPRFTGNRPTGELALLVFVKRKLATMADPARRREAEAAAGHALIKPAGTALVAIGKESLPIDVVSAEEPEPVVPDGEPVGTSEPGGLDGPFRAGIRIVSSGGGFGTVTAIAVQPESGAVGVVTCAHVAPRAGLAMAFADGYTLGEAGEPVVSVSVADRWPGLGIRAAADESWAVDATFVRLRPQVRARLEQRGLLRLGNPAWAPMNLLPPAQLLGQRVSLFGQTTGRRAGCIRALGFEWSAAGGNRLFADYLVQHAGSPDDNVSERGDSGKPAYTADGRLTALVWDGARRSLGGFPKTTWAAATDAAFAFQRLRVTALDCPPL